MRGIVTCEESYQAGIAYGKQYRKAHRSWTRSEHLIAGEAADQLAGHHQDRYDRTSFFHGVIQGLRPFTAADFEATFERNKQAAPFKAQARLHGRLLSIAVFDEQQYQAILKQWRAEGAVIEEEEKSSQDAP